MSTLNAISLKAYSLTSNSIRGWLVPDHLPEHHIRSLRTACGQDRFILLHAERHRPVARRLADAAAKRLVSYDTYNRLRPILDNQQLLLSIDGRMIEGPIHGIEALILTWIFDSRSANRLIEQLPDLRWVHSMVTGVNHLNLSVLAARGIALTFPRAIHASRIAEFVLSLVYADSKHLFDHHDASRMRRATFLASCELSSMTMGIIGFGAIGRATARLAAANHMRVLAYVRSAQDVQADEGVVLSTDLLTVLRNCDVLVMALPLTSETQRFLDAERISVMQPHALLINVGRGDTIVERDLAEALAQHRIRRACLDVLDDPLTGRPFFSPPPNHPLMVLPNVLFTGYSSSHSAMSADELHADLLANVERYRSHGRVENVIDLTSGY